MVGTETPSWNELTERIESRVSKKDFIDRFPFLAEGWDKSDIHSIGLSYYTQLGVDLGYAASVDIHVFDRHFREITQQDTRKSTAHIHDSVWYDRDSSEPVCAVEFEKANSADDIRQKAENLVATYEIYPSIETLILNCWNSSEIDTPRIALEPFKYGYESDDGVRFDPPDADVLVYESTFPRSERKGIVGLGAISVIERF